MLKNPEKVRSIEAAHEKELYGSLSYSEKLRRYEALWAHVRSLNPRFTRRWREDLDADIAIARVLNGLPPES